MVLINKSYRSKTYTTEEFIERANKVHNNKYSYSKTKYVRSTLKVTITCRIHGDFEQIANNHVGLGYGCRKCSESKSSAEQKRTLEDFITLAKNVHEDTYDYDNVIYERADRKVTITCKIHGNFTQTPTNHLQGKGCVKCARYSSSSGSKIANKWLDSLNVLKENREIRLKEFPKRPVDAYDASTNTVYQFHGDYWHGNLNVYDPSSINSHTGKSFGELYNATLMWDKQIRDLGYNLIVMWEDDFRQILN